MNDDFNDIGIMEMPSGFSYRDVSDKGKPQHKKFDEFYARHPFMDIGKRAKIFSPFDALKGFNDAIADKEVLYEVKIILDDEKKDELNRKLSVLQTLTPNSRAAKRNHIVVTVTYFAPCTDRNNEAYGFRGQYVSLSGVCMKVDSTITKTITIDTTTINMDDILMITSADERLSETEW